MLLRLHPQRRVALRHRPRRLSASRHRITMVARDSDSMESRADVNVFVGQSVYLLLLVRR